MKRTSAQTLDDISMLNDVPYIHAVTLLCLALPILLLSLRFFSLRYRSSVTRPYPPGPKGLPLIGNALNMPKTRVWLTFIEWGNTYGTSHLNQIEFK